MNLLEKVKAAIEREGLIPPDSTVIVGISGGADSVALLHMLHRFGYTLTVAHLNHSIRGAEADADEAFVKALCAKLGVECITAKTDVSALAKEKGVSIEMAARQARHDFFRSIISSFKFQVSGFPVALAHHADDQLETFFLRAARGAGPGGLGGMRFFQTLEELTLIRPMLRIRRAEIFQWLEKEKIKWREDATNTDETIPRNLVRRQILPILGKLNERAAENILRAMEILRDEDDFLSATAALEMIRIRGQPYNRRKSMNIGLTPEGLTPEGLTPELLAKPKALQRRIVQRWLIEHGAKPDFDSIEKVIGFAAQTDGSKSLDLAGLRITNEYGVLKTVNAVSSPRFSVTMKEGGGILRGPWCASVSLAKVAGREVTVRAARPGDRMTPYGMEGSRKLQDIFTDLKIPKTQREQWPVAECGEEIIWLPGYRIARGWELSSDTEPALHLFASGIDSMR